MHRIQYRNTNEQFSRELQTTVQKHKETEQMHRIQYRNTNEQSSRELQTTAQKHT